MRRLSGFLNMKARHVSSGVRAKKSFGQHFLCDTSVIERIIEAAELTPSQSVLEIGPGTGVLTAALLEAGAKLTAIEADADLIPLLEKRFGSALTLQHADAKQALLWLNEEPFSYRVVANLPYNIASHLVSLLLYNAPLPERCVLMVQKEVGERWLGRDGEMSVVGLSVRLRSRVERLFVVPPTAFQPPPKVDSVVMRLTPYRPDEDGFHSAEEAEKILQLAKVGFASPRKYLISNLSVLENKAFFAQLFDELELLHTLRPQELTCKQWEQLARRWYNRG